MLVSIKFIYISNIQPFDILRAKIREIPQKNKHFSLLFTVTDFIWHFQ